MLTCDGSECVGECDADVGADGVADESDDDAADEHFFVAHGANYGRHKRRGAEQGYQGDAEEVAADLEDAAEEQVQQGGHYHDEQQEAADGQRSAVEGLDVELGGHYNAENEDKEHAQLEGFGNLADFFGEGGDDGECGDGEDDDQLVESAGDEQREACADGEEADGDGESDERAQEDTAFQQGAILLDAVVEVAASIGLLGGAFVAVRQEFAEQLVPAAHDEHDDGEGDDHLEGQHGGDGGGVHVQRCAEGVEVHGAAGVDAGHHGRHVGDVADAGVTEDEEPADNGCQHSDDSAGQCGGGLRQRLGPQLEVAVEEHQRNGDGHGDVHDHLLDAESRAALLKVGEAEEGGDDAHCVGKDDGACRLRPFVAAEQHDDNDGKDEISGGDKRDFHDARLLLLEHITDFHI